MIYLGTQHQNMKLTLTEPYLTSYPREKFDTDPRIRHRKQEGANARLLRRHRRTESKRTTGEPSRALQPLVKCGNLARREWERAVRGSGNGTKAREQGGGGASPQRAGLLDASGRGSLCLPPTPFLSGAPLVQPGRTRVCHQHSPE